MEQQTVGFFRVNLGTWVLLEKKRFEMTVSYFNNVQLWFVMVRGRENYKEALSYFTYNLYQLTIKISNPMY